MNKTTHTKLSAFFSAYPLRRYSEGEMVIFADKTIPPIFFLLKGRIVQYSIADAGNKIVLNTFHPPAFFPMQYAVTGQPNDYFFEAVTDVQVRVAPHEEVLKFLEDNSDVLMNLLARVYRGTMGMMGKMEQLMTGTASARLWLELTISAERFGELQADGSLLVKFTEMQLAQQTGLARETVSRELQKLKKQGLISSHRGGINVFIPNSISE